MHLVGPSSLAQTINRDRALGAAAGFASGVGFTYRQIPQRKIGFQVTFIGWKVGNNHFLSVGVQPMYPLSAGPTDRLYVLAAGGYFSWPNESYVNIGAGLGLEMFSTEQVSTSAELALTYLVGRGNIFPSLQVGIFYYF